MAVSYSWYSMATGWEAMDRDRKEDIAPFNGGQSAGAGKADQINA